MIKIFIFDTNTLISAALSPGSVNRKAYDRAREIGITVHSSSTFAEFSEALSRPKFDKYISIQRRHQSIIAFEKTSQLVTVSTNINLCRDPKDNKFLNLAIDAGAACIVTWDKDLLILNPFEEIPIVTPADFLTMFTNSQT
jgi:putative PIN family toxin of toxin-antitoxin system